MRGLSKVEIYLGNYQQFWIIFTHFDTEAQAQTGMHALVHMHTRGNYLIWYGNEALSKTDYVTSVVKDSPTWYEND